MLVKVPLSGSRAGPLVPRGAEAISSDAQCWTDTQHKRKRALRGRGREWFTPPAFFFPKHRLFCAGYRAPAIGNVVVPDVIHSPEREMKRSTPAKRSTRRAAGFSPFSLARPRPSWPRSESGEIQSHRPRASTKCQVG